MPVALPSERFRRLGLLLLSVAFVSAGLNHFWHIDFYISIMPPWLPAHEELVLISGLFEIIGGLGVLYAPVRRLAGYGLIALMIAVFPANIHMALHPGQFADIASATGLLVRLPVQFILIGWAWWATR